MDGSSRIRGWKHTRKPPYPRGELYSSCLQTENQKNEISETSLKKKQKKTDRNQICYFSHT